MQVTAESNYAAGTNVAEVDSVLTTSEVQQLIEQQGVTLAELPGDCMDSLLGPGPCDSQLYNIHGGAGMHYSCHGMMHLLRQTV